MVDGTTSRYPQRNFHNVEHPNLPMSAIYKIDIKHPPELAEQGIYQVGNVVMLRNVRAKEYKGAMEMIWAEKVTAEQAATGWNIKKPVHISPTDERALQIEQ